MARQKIYHYCYFLLILLLLSCSSLNKTEDDTLSFDNASINTKVNITPGYGWRLNKGTATMASTNLYNDKATLLISPDSSGESNLSFLLNTSEIGMDEVTFSGKYKVISGINAGDNWDYELFRVLPEIANAKDKKERNKRLNKWIDKYGKIKNTKDYTIDDSLQYSRIINLDWINNDECFDKELINKFNKIKNAARSDRLNYYVATYNSQHNPDFRREKKYANIKWEDQGFRMLTLFKLWNVIEYSFPYTDYTDIPWENLLNKFIPDFLLLKVNPIMS